MYIYCIPPIDFWKNATVAGEKETQIVLGLMPEEPRERMVFKTFVPYEQRLIPVYICKADNNGDTYLFSKYDFVSFYNNYVKEV